ncbi:leucine-rich repeat protein [Levilactobacillus fujinensis]|uniref:Leucine-rich repeat protein n=1 Tax=Levilactobacillus fujinensis TaxID=2486024 RepID=A0ABW1TE59_9LACO|nr:leucine-rich repeat protein [Levilactobacillus fujinensis]
MREKGTTKARRNERQWVALALATTAIGVGAITAVPVTNAKADTVTSASTTSEDEGEKTPANGLTITSAAEASSTATASQSTATSSSAVSATAVSSTSSSTVSAISSATAPASSAASTTNVASSVATIAPTSTVASVASSQGIAATNLASSAASQSTVASSASVTIAQPTQSTPASTVETASTVFNWQTDETTGTASIMGVNQAVSGLLNLPSTYVANGKTYQVTSIGPDAFASQTGLTTGLTGVTFGNGLQSIGESAFAYLNNLKTANFTADQALTTIGSQAFVGTGLTQITLPNSVTTIGSDAFKYVGGITTLQLPTNLVSLGAGSFSENLNLTTADLTPATGLTTIGNEAFAGDGLTALTIPATVQDIDVGAFMTNQQLTDVRFASASQLVTIADSAFMYDTALKTVTLPDSVQTIGAQAFLSDQSLQTVSLGSGVRNIDANAFTYDGKLTTVDLSRATQLVAIGDGAFEYAGLSGTLTLPANVQSLGNLAFAGNQITTLNLDNALQSLGNDVFGSNQLVQITGPALPGLAQNQFVTIFADPHDLTVTDLLSVKVGQLTPADVTVSAVANATYQNGQFVVTPGQSSFTFDWSLANAVGATVYAGQATVILSDPAIKAINSTVLAGSVWQPADNFVSATAPDHSVVPFSAVTVTGTVDSMVAGTYPITYNYQDASSTITVTVTKRPGTYQLVGAPQVTYTGERPSLVPADYQVDLPDGQTYTPQFGDLTTTAEATVGTYSVTLTPAGMAHLQALPESDIYDWTLGGQGSLQVIPASVTITIENESKVVGDMGPTILANVSGLPTMGAPLNYTIQRVVGETAGTYPISAVLGLNPNYDVTVLNGVLTITAAPVSSVTKPAQSAASVQSSSAATSGGATSSSVATTKPDSATSIASSAAAPATSASQAASSTATSGTSNSQAASSAAKGSQSASSAATAVTSGSQVTSNTATPTTGDSEAASSAAAPATSASQAASSAATSETSNSQAASSAFKGSQSAASAATAVTSGSQAVSAATSATSSSQSASNAVTPATSPSSSATAPGSSVATSSQVSPIVQLGSTADSAAAPTTSNAPDRTGETHTVTGDVAVPATAKKAEKQGKPQVEVDRVMGKQPTTKFQSTVQASAKDLASKATKHGEKAVQLRKAPAKPARWQYSSQSARQATLPQTGEHTTADWSVLGILLGVLGVLGFRRRRD